ncbi:hypothetical protein F5X96DRAFT_688178 [Biscogniauxia mediterranea]|nr:hypothetical protein F5X96DRAFT_688178 [Biscogniauxia mediterranea]
MAEEQETRMVLDGGPATNTTTFTSLSMMPTEIIETIVEKLKIEPLPTTPWIRLHTDYTEKKQVLLNMSLVSKRMHDIANKVLYRNVLIYSGEQASLFLRTLWIQPDVREFTRHIAILCPIGSYVLGCEMTSTWEKKCNKFLAPQAVNSNKVMKDNAGFPQLNLAIKGPQMLNLQREFDLVDKLSITDPRPLKLLSAILALLEKVDDVLLDVPSYGSYDEGYLVPTSMGLFDPVLHPLIPAPKTLRMYAARAINGIAELPIDPLHLQFPDIGRGTRSDNPHKGTVTRFDCYSDNGDWSPLFGEIRSCREILDKLPALQQRDIDKFSVLQDLRLYDSKTSSNYIYMFTKRFTNLRTLHWVTSDGRHPEKIDPSDNICMGLEDALNPAANRLQRLHLERRGTSGATLQSTVPLSLAHFSVLTYLAIDANLLLGYCYEFRGRRLSFSAVTIESDDNEATDGSGYEDLGEMPKLPTLASLLPRSLVELVTIDRATYLGLSTRTLLPTFFISPLAKIYTYTIVHKIWEFVADCPTTHPHLQTITLRTFRKTFLSKDRIEELVEAYAGIGVSFSWEWPRVEAFNPEDDAMWAGPPEDIDRRNSYLTPWESGY